MKRRDFIQHACTACLAVTGAASLLPACAPVQFISGKLNNDGLLLDANDFKTSKNTYKQYVVVRNEQLKFPVCVYRFSDSEYSALWMECAHQGAEVNVIGSNLQCPAHGSEFDNRGRVTNGPAERNLRSFPVTVNNNEIFIDLRKK